MFLVIIHYYKTNLSLLLGAYTLENQEWEVKMLFDGMATLPTHPAVIANLLH